jgi:hypothetical protein
VHRAEVLLPELRDNAIRIPIDDVRFGFAACVELIVFVARRGDGQAGDLALPLDGRQPAAALVVDNAVYRVCVRTTVRPSQPSTKAFLALRAAVGMDTVDAARAASRMETRWVRQATWWSRQALCPRPAGRSCGFSGRGSPPDFKLDDRIAVLSPTLTFR